MPLPLLLRAGARRLVPVAAAVVLVAAVASLLAGQDGTRHSAFILLRGTDTLAVERVQRSGTSVAAQIGSPGQPRVELHFTLGADHGMAVTRFTLRAANAAADAAPLQSGTVTFVGDSANLEMRAGSNARTLRLATRAGALPVSNNDFVVMEQVARMARARGLTQLTVPLFSMAGGATVDGAIEFLAPDSARFKIAATTIDVILDAQSHIIRASIPAPGLRIVVLEGAAAQALAFGRADYSAPPGAQYTAEEVVVRTPAGHVLTGTLTRPIRSGLVPAVVTITGSGAQDRDAFIPIAGGVRIFRQVADTLSRRGIAVLRLDDRAVGGSGGNVNGTSADFADDIRAALAFLRARPDIDGTRLALVGHSEGGMIAPMIARSDAALAAVVLMAGTAYTGRQIIDYQIASGVERMPTIPAAKRDSAAAAHRAAFDATTARAPWMQYFLTYDPIPTARQVKQPVLILHGSTDRQVREEEAHMLERAMRDGGNRKVTLRVFPDRNHLFLRDADGHPAGYDKLTDPKVDGEVLGTLADWLALTLRAP